MLGFHSSDHSTSLQQPEETCNNVSTASCETCWSNVQTLSLKPNKPNTFQSQTLQLMFPIKYMLIVTFHSIFSFHFQTMHFYIHACVCVLFWSVSPLSGLFFSKHTGICLHMMISNSRFQSSTRAEHTTGNNVTL